MLAIVDVKTLSINDCNAMLCHTFEYTSAEELIGRSLRDLHPVDNQKGFDQALSQLKSNRSIENQLVQLKSKSGKTINAIFSATCIASRNGGKELYSCSWRDIDKLKHSQALAAYFRDEADSVEKSLGMSRSETDQSKFFSNVMSDLNTDGWWSWNLSQPNIIFISANLKKLLGYDPDDNPTRLSWMTEITHPDDANAFTQAAARLFDFDTPMNIERRLRCKNGEYKWFICRGCAIKDSTGSPFRLIGTYNEVSTLKQTEQRLRHKNDELYEFSYRTSHDLKSPLTSMAGLGQCVLADLEDGETPEALQNISKITAEAKKLLKLVTDITELSRADLADEESETINIAKLCRDLKHNTESQALSNEVSVNFSTSGSVDFISQPVRVFNTLYQLIVNGVHHRNAKPIRSWVNVHLAVEDNQLLAVVADNGVGIPATMHDKIFERFQRCNTELSEGSGLGLSIVKSNIDRLDAEIAFDSTDKGTVFTVRVPQARKGEFHAL